MYYENNGNHTNTLSTRCRVFSVKTSGTYSNDCYEWLITCQQQCMKMVSAWGKLI